jgi:tetratricopeptide (TPR) repeat protein
VGQITRICNLALAAALLLSGGAAQAKVSPDSALSKYARARVADASGDEASALKGYAEALGSEPENAQIAERAVRQAIRLGDKPLALRAARVLERQKAVPADVRLLLLSEAFMRGDWRGAELHLDAIDDNGTFAFLSPSLRGWLAFAAGKGSVEGALAERSQASFGATYADEQRVLLLAALKRGQEAISGLAQARADDWLRIMLAARLAQLIDSAAAFRVLEGQGRQLSQARDGLSRPASLPAPVLRPHQAQAIVLARLASDLLRDSAAPLATTIARLAVMADPDQPLAADVLARVLARDGQNDEALRSVTRLAGMPLQESRAADLRFELLSADGRHAEMLTLANSMLAGNEAVPSLYLRLATAQSALKQHAQAAESIRKAIAIAEGKDGGTAGWSVWLALGRELDAADDWPAAKKALLQAVERGPDQPGALNHLGYTMLVRGESLAEATQLIAKASALRPSDPAITDSFGWALYKSGRVDEAVAALEKAYGAEPTEPEIGEHLGDAYWAAGRRIEARYAWAAAQVQSEEPGKVRLQNKIDFGMNPAR